MRFEVVRILIWPTYLLTTLGIQGPYVTCTVGSHKLAPLFNLFWTSARTTYPLSSSSCSLPIYIPATQRLYYVHLSKREEKQAYASLAERSMDSLHRRAEGVPDYEGNWPTPLYCTLYYSAYSEKR